MQLTKAHSRTGWAAILALVFSAAFLWATGLVPRWGQWYSVERAYRDQTTAFFHGSLALSHNPADLDEDLVWHNGGVQQVWGLGIPIWLTPFEALAKLSGQPAFPERLAFGAALMLAAFAAFKLLLLPPELANGKSLLDLLLNPFRLCAVGMVLLFPPIVNACRLHFTIYDQVVVYAYLCAVGLFLGIFSFAKKPGKIKYLLLASFAGFCPMVRPTLLAYSLSTMALLVLLGWKADFGWRVLLAGGGLFALGGGLLFVTNFIRFGSGLEFGYDLNLNGFPVWYFTRFYCPYQNESYFSAARELFGSIFFVTQLNGFDHLREGFFWGQSSYARWRQFYMTTFDSTYLMLILGGWAAILTCGIRRSRKRLTTALPAGIVAAGIWSLASAIMLSAFYLKSPVIASRYMLDFAASFTAAIVGLILLAEWALATSPKFTQFLPYLIFGIGFVWLGWEIRSVESVPVLIQHPVTQSWVVRNSARKSIPCRMPGSASQIGSNLESVCNIPFNGAGWDAAGAGAMETVAVIFVKDTEFLELHVAALEKEQEGQVDYSKLRVKIGLEDLELESIKPHNGEHVVTFKAPTKPVYRNGIQAAFIAYVDPKGPVTGESPLKMLKAIWHRDRPSSSAP